MHFVSLEIYFHTVVWPVVLFRVFGWLSSKQMSKRVYFITVHVTISYFIIIVTNIAERFFVFECAAVQYSTEQHSTVESSAAQYSRAQYGAVRLLESLRSGLQ